MITDSQVGIQRPSGLRRAEQTASSGVLGLVTDHYVAKIVALLFAGVLVALIDRELETTLLDVDFDVRAGSMPQPGDVPAGRRQLILEPEPGVAVRRFKPTQVHVTINGQQKLAETVKKVLVGVVPIKAEWLKDVGGNKHSISRAIVGSDVRIGTIRGIEITLDPPIQVDLDPEVARDVPLRASPKDVAPGLVAEIAFDPPHVRVLGPETLFESGAIDQITIAIPTEGRTQEFTHPVSALPDEVLQLNVRMAADQRVVARIRFSKSEQGEVEVKDIPIKPLGSFGSEYEFSVVGLPKLTVTATFAGTPEAVAYWNEHLQDLRNVIYPVINTATLLAKVNPQPGTPASETADVEVLKVPGNLKLVSVTPAQVEVSVSKK